MTNPRDAGSSIGPVDPTLAVPYYVQVQEVLREQINRGAWKPGDQLPTEPELCRIFVVSRTVIRQALNELRIRGLIVRGRGKGTFVAEPKISESFFQELTGFYQDMKAKGFTLTTQVLDQSLVPASPKVAAALCLDVGTPVIRIERLRFVQNEALVLVTTYLPHELCPQLLHEDLSHKSLYAFLEQQGLFIAESHRALEATTAGEQEAHLLGVSKGAPLLELSSVSQLDDGQPIEYYHALHRGDRTRFEVKLVARHHQRVEASQHQQAESRLVTTSEQHTPA